MQGSLETEVKIRISDRQAVLELLRNAGFSLAKARVFEANILYDRRQGSSLRDAGMLLRLRRAGENCVITWKGPGQSGPHKARPEVETSIGSIEAMERILNEIGFKRTFRYEKYRTEFESAADADGTITLDETPIGDFVELEGPGDWIDRTAGRLGFRDRDYILQSYGSLYQAHCAEHGCVPADMVFDS